MHLSVRSIAPGRVELGGELDIAAEENLEAITGTLLSATGSVLVDVSGLGFMDSVGIRWLIRCAKALDGRGCLILHGVRGEIARVLEVAEVDGLIENLHVMQCRIEYGAEVDTTGTAAAD